MNANLICRAAEPAQRRGESYILSTKANLPKSETMAKNVLAEYLVLEASDFTKDGLESLIYWRDVKKSAVVFGGALPSCWPCRCSR